MSQYISIPKESFADEKRVATVPEIVEKLIKLGFKIGVETGAGEQSNISDNQYQKAGAEILNEKDIWKKADIIFKVRSPSEKELKLIRNQTTLLSFVWPAQNPSLMDAMAAKKLNVLALDSVPRISRAQKLDALSSMANIAGYRAVIEAAHHFGRFFTGQITAAGKVPPAKVFVIGAGVAGLSAIGTSVGLGAIVRANDTRPEVADQVKSMGAEFIGVEYQEEGSGVGGYAKIMSKGYQKAQLEVFANQAKDVDIIITTALIPGKPAPKLITTKMVQSMKPGSVIVDMAAEQGGNCQLTVPNEVVVKHGITIIGYTDLPSRLSKQSSTLYATNLFRLTEELCKNKDGKINIDMEDEVIRGTTVIKEGKITWPPPAPKIITTSKPASPPVTPKTKTPDKKTSHGISGPLPIKSTIIIAALLAIAFWFVGAYAPKEFFNNFTVFVLACFVGYMVIWNVTPSLHTPLMSITNAISSIIIIGSLIIISKVGFWITLLSILGVFLTSINMFGGFAVTRRMLTMFRKQKD